MKIYIDTVTAVDYSVIRWFDRMIDETDRDILNIVQRDGRVSNAEIARQVALAPSAVLERLRKLEERGVVRGYNACIDPKQVGYGLTAFISVRTSECNYEADAQLANIPEVLEVHDVAGEDSYLLKVRVADPEGLSRLLKEKIKAITTVVSTRTTVVLQTVKETSMLPLDRCEAVAKGKGKKK